MLEAVNNVVATKRRVINDTTKQQFSKMISVIDWSTIAGIESVDDTYESFIELVSSKFNYCFPVVSKKEKMLDLQKPYISSDIKSLIREKHRLQRLYMKWPITYEKDFKTIRNRVNTRIREAKALYCQTKLRESSGNENNTWKILNNLTSRGNNNNDNVELCVNGNIVSSPVDIAIEFNRYFAIVGESIAEGMSQSQEFQKYIDSQDMNTKIRFNIPTFPEIKYVIGKMKEASSSHDRLP